MPKFNRLVVLTHDPKHVAATVREAERLGYTFGHKLNFRFVEAVVLHNNGTASLRVVFGNNDRAEHIDYGYKVVQTRHLRREHPAIETLSRDGLSVLAIGGEALKPKLELVHVPEVVHVPTVASLWVKGVAWLKAFVKRVVKHFR